jgi:diguanylate cyclase (GGDEF)-like protein
MGKDNKYHQDRWRIIFEYSPVAIWEEDFSALAKLRNDLKQKGVKNFRSYLDKNREVVQATFRKLVVLNVNQEALKLYGAKTKKELFAHLGKTIHADVMGVLIDEFAALLEGKKTFEAQVKSRTLTGRSYDVAMRVSVPDVYQDTFKRVVVTFQDISYQKRYERHLKRLAQTDGLTRILNHGAICYRLEEEFRRALRYHLDMACMMIDLDDFKKINDTHGHQKGDGVLKKTANLIQEHLREVDVVGRYGGDEFLVLLPETSPQNAQIAAQRLKNIFDSLVKKDGDKKNFSTISIGVGGLPLAGIKSTKELIMKVDRAMYSVKKNGGNNILLVSS